MLSEHQTESEKDRGLCTRLDELLRNRKHEENDRRTQRLAVPTYPDVLLETVETAKDEEPASHWFGDSGVLRAHGSQQPERVLENGQHDNGQTCVVKRKTDTRRLL